MLLDYLMCTRKFQQKGLAGCAAALARPGMEPRVAPLISDFLPWFSCHEQSSWP
jgi:hypothetical protein